MVKFLAHKKELEISLGMHGLGMFGIYVDF